jgi:hypothetical protein
MAGFTTYTASTIAPSLGPEPEDPDVLVFGDLDDLAFAPQTSTVAHAPLDVEVSALLGRFFSPRGPQEASVSAHHKHQPKPPTSDIQCDRCSGKVNPRILAPSPLLPLQLHRNVMHASRFASGCVNQLASSLRRVGYAVELTHSSAAAHAARGSFSSLRHSFLTIRTDAGGGSMPAIPRSRPTR